ncbi:MAG: hypothetical protein FWC66_02015 [Oscillospiraceae bacterium]|nr:hypothetical protein [Oscillospiraceae bacterium]
MSKAKPQVVAAEREKLDKLHALQDNLKESLNAID